MQTRIDGPSSDEIGKSPGRRVLLLAQRIGEHAVADWCADLLTATAAYDDPRRPPIAWLGGRHAAAQLEGRGFEAGNQDYWPRVWAARGLMYVWHGGAETAVVAGLSDPAWRVREMSAKIARRRAVMEAEPILHSLLDDPVLRVRAAAEAALEELARRDRPTESARFPGSGRPRSSPPRQRPR